MSLISQIDDDLKSAMLGGDKDKAETLKGLKNAFLYESLNLGVKEKGLDDPQTQKVLAREAKKRQEAADLYAKAGADDRAAKELAEKEVINHYLPAQMDESELKVVIGEEISKLDSPTMADMGKLIGTVRTRTEGQADGALIAKLVREALES